MRLVVALDLEGTLISNAVSAFPRPGLKRFIEFTLKVADRVVMFTTVREERARELLQLIENEGFLPAGFAAAVEFVPYSGKTKDLSAAGEPDSATVLLVDDQPSMVHPGQEAYWIPIAEFMPPFDQEDHELERVAEVIREIRDDIMVAEGIKRRAGEVPILINPDDV
jgi:hypothetical protein